MASWKLAPAIAAGCTCVLKPAEQTPLTIMEVASWFEELGLPRASSTSSTVLARRQERARGPSRRGQIAFTGSSAVGK